MMSCIVVVVSLFFNSLLVSNRRNNPASSILCGISFLFVVFLSKGHMLVNPFHEFRKTGELGLFQNSNLPWRPKRRILPLVSIVSYCASIRFI